MADPRFPFGAPSTPQDPRRATQPTGLFVLGVYPSALHVHWTPPAWASVLPGVKPIGALAISDEPTVFWDGIAPDPDDLVDAWKQQVGFHEGDDPEQWGHVRQAGNGTSGRPVVDRVLEPLGISPGSTWFSDCVNTYFVKSGEGSQGDAWEKRYAPFANAIGRPAPTIPARPTVDDLVATAASDHRTRLRTQLLESESALVVTLGEEARQVLVAIADDSSGPPTKPLTQRAERRIDEDYGEAGTAQIGNRSFAWMALVHPGQRSKSWAMTHDRWAVRCGLGR
jgi:hypothetical protein